MGPLPPLPHGFAEPWPLAEPLNVGPQAFADSRAACAVVTHAGIVLPVLAGGGACGPLKVRHGCAVARPRISPGMGGPWSFCAYRDGFTSFVDGGVSVPLDSLGLKIQCTACRAFSAWAILRRVRPLP